MQIVPVERNNTMSNTAKYFAKNANTGLYFDGSSFSSSEPTKQFDASEIAFIKATWDNVVVDQAA